MKLTNHSIEYQSGDTTLRGYAAWDKDIKEPVPGIIVIHEWWGLNGYIRKRADMLAEQGYYALAIDMFGEGVVAESPDQAADAMNAILQDMETGGARLQAGYDVLTSQSQVDAQKTAAIGYCFGGAMALHMARLGMPLDAVVSFHGALGSFHKPAVDAVEANILICHGGDDAMVMMDDVATFRQEMNDANANYEVIVYPGAKHGFTNKQADENAKKYDIPLGYNARADKESWAAMMALFQGSF